MSKNQQGFSFVFVILAIFVIFAVAATGYFVFSNNQVPSKQNNTSNIGHAYYADSTTFKVDLPPKEDSLLVNVNDKKEIHLYISLKLSDKVYKLVPNVSFAISEEKLNGLTTKSLNLQVQKIEDLTNKAEAFGLDVKVGSRTEMSFAPEITPGHYSVQVTIDTVDPITNQKLASKILHSSFDYN